MHGANGSHIKSKCKIPTRRQVPPASLVACNLPTNASHKDPDSISNGLPLLLFSWHRFATYPVGYQNAVVLRCAESHKKLKRVNSCLGKQTQLRNQSTIYTKTDKNTAKTTNLSKQLQWKTTIRKKKQKTGQFFYNSIDHIAMPGDALSAS